MGVTLLHPLFLVPAVFCAVAAWRLRARGGDGWERVMSAPVLALLRPRAAAGNVNFALLALAIVFAALTSPARKADTENSYTLDDGLLVLADVSKSMTLTDIRPSRMAAAREAALAISAAAGARPVALIVYAGDAYLAEPFATDRRQFDAYARTLDHGLIAAEGSDVGRALSLARAVIVQSGVAHARLVLVGDGGGLDAGVTEIAARFARRGYRLDVVVTALPGATQPSATDAALVDAIAQAGGGAAVWAGPEGNVDLAPLALAGTVLPSGGLTHLSLLSTEWQNQSHYLLLAALPFVLLLFRRGRA